MLFFKKLRRLTKHKKLCEEWALANSCESVSVPSTSGSSTASCSTASASTSASASSSRTGPDDTDSAPETTFALKYLGSTLVDSPSSEKETAEAIKTVISMAKASGRKLPRVTLAVSLRGIRMTDPDTQEDHLRISIYRISYCSADATHDHVFAFIATNLNETNECHAYLCPKRKIAQTVTLTVAQAFNTAYELWQLSQLDSKMYHVQDKSPNLSDEKKETDENSTKDEEDGKASRNSSEKTSEDSQKTVLIEIPTETTKARVESWVSFDEEAAPDEIDEGIPLKPLKSPTSPSKPILPIISTSPNNGNNNNLVKTKESAPASNNHNNNNVLADDTQESKAQKNDVILEISSEESTIANNDVVCSS